MTQPAKAHEPSMEEILASIRRIIADEETAKPQPRDGSEPPGRTAAASAVAEPLPPEAFEESGEPVEQEDIESAPFPQQSLEPEPEIGALDSDPDAEFPDLDAHSNDDFEDASAAPASAARSAGGHLRAIDPPAPLLSAEATAAVNSAFGTLAQTVLVQNARTLEDLVREMLRPMLKTWLDDNLPNLVERLVRAEIERVSRGHPG